MANIKSQQKRNRQNEKRRLKNMKVRSSIRTAKKKVTLAIDAKEPAEKIDELFKKFVVTIDMAAGKGIIHKNTAARNKSSIAKKVNSARKGAS